MTTINIRLEGSSAIPAYCKYDRQNEPQPAYLEFDPSDAELDLFATYNVEVGSGVPVDVYHRKTLRFNISPLASRDSLLALAEDEKLADLLSAVRDAYEERWNGNNYVGTYDGLSEHFEEEVERHLHDVLTDGEAWEAADWMDTTGVIENLLDHGSVSAYAQDLIDRAEATIIGDMEAVCAEACAYEVANYIRFQSEPSEQIKQAAALLAAHDTMKYGDLAEDYASEFEGDE